MSGGTSETFHTAGEQLRKAEAKVGGRHHGQTPADSDISQLKSVVDSQKAGDIDTAQSNLPLPDQPDAPGDLKSANQRTTGSGIGGAVPGAAGTVEADALRGSATADSSVRKSAEEFKTHTAP